MKDKRRRQQKGSGTRPRRTPVLRIVALLGAAVLGFAGWWLVADWPQQAAGPPDPNAFQPTVENARSAPGSAPGMVWIPGGEFSMGAAESPDMNMVGMQATSDPGRFIGSTWTVSGWTPPRSPTTRSRCSSPHGLCDHRRARRGPRLPRRPAGEPRGRGRWCCAARSRGPAERSLPVVGVREGGELATPEGAGSPRWPRGAIRWCRSRMRTRWPMRSGRVSGCRRKRNGSSRRVAV